MRISDWSSDVCSSDLRTNTTVLSTYVHPITQRYIERLEDQLKDGGYEKPLYMMQSNGGIATAKAAKANPIAMVESGPARGIFAAAYMGSHYDEPNLLVLHIGGTTGKCPLVEGGWVQGIGRAHV